MTKRISSHIGLAALPVVSFLVLNWIYGYVIVLQSETNDCFFMFGRQFLLTFFDHPAGWLRYCGRFLAQFHHYTWLGALIVTACITCFGVVFYRVLAKLKGQVHISQAIVPCVLVLALHTYTIYLPQDTLGLLASCAVFLGWLYCGGRTWRRVYALAAAPVAYFVLGFYVWFFTAWVIAFEWFDAASRRGRFFAIGYAVFSLAAPLAAWRWIYNIHPYSALMCPLMLGPPYRTGSPPYTGAQLAVGSLLVVMLCGSMLLLPFGDRLFAGTRFAAVWRSRPARWNRVVLAVAIPVLVVLLHLLQYDGVSSRYVAYRRLYKEERWDALLEKAKEKPFEETRLQFLKDIRLQFMTNFALYKKGRLLGEMFDYPQPWRARGLVFNFFGWGEVEDDSFRAMYNCDLYYELGHVNAAFRHVYNYMCGAGATYEVLERMAQCGMANGNYAFAAKYLSMLERTLFHAGFARRYKALIADRDAADREFGDIRKRLPVVETRFSFYPPDLILPLLEAHPRNAMALQYLMAWRLLDRNSIDQIPPQIKRFKEAGCASIPAYCQEALLLLERQQGVSIDLRGFRYDKAARARVDSFLPELARWGEGEGSLDQLRAAFGGTYTFYYYVSPLEALSDQRWMAPAAGGLGGPPREE